MCRGFAQRRLNNDETSTILRGDEISCQCQSDPPSSDMMTDRAFASQHRWVCLDQMPDHQEHRFDVFSLDCHFLAFLISAMACRTVKTDLGRSPSSHSLHRLSADLTSELITFEGFFGALRLAFS